MQPVVLEPSPHVTIIIPMYNDEEWIAEALESCLRQTLASIEIICVDDASTDGGRQIVERYQAVDPRIKLIAHDRNRSAFQARRAGVVAATAPYVMFLDGDDDLLPHAAEKALAKATSTGADLVGFGVEVVDRDGRTGGAFQRRLQPSHARLEGEGIIRGLFPTGAPARGQIWRYLFSTALLRIAYAHLPQDLELYRANDLPIAYLAASMARLYVSLPTRLYRYHFGRGASGQRIEDASQFEFYLQAVDSIDSIAPAIREKARKHADPDPFLESFASARLSVIGNILNYLVNNSTEEVRADCLQLLHARVSESDVVLAATGFCPAAVTMLAQVGTRIELDSRPTRKVLLTTKTLTTGGVSGVLLSQAQFLMESGFDVVIVARRPGSSIDLVPHGTRFIELPEGSLLSQVQRWGDICRAEEVDVVIDHQILYSRDWPSYALAARAAGAPTIGWLHNFAGRPIYDLNDLTTLITNHLGALARLITLSPLDVAFWKLRGISHVAYLPNPVSPMILEASIEDIAKPAPEGRPLRLLWWGRLEQHTKQVRQLLLVAAELIKLGAEFEMDIVGPGWAGLEPSTLREEARKRGLEGRVRVRGPLYGNDLIAAIDEADMFVNVSVIEGYPLTILEAQARGLPVVMYELPWLAIAADNGGIVTVPQSSAAALAAEIVAIGKDPVRYDDLSHASLAAARRKREFDFATAYEQLVTGHLPEQFSPEPSLGDAQKLIDLLVFFAERNAGLRAKTMPPAAAPTRSPAGVKKTAAAARKKPAPAVKKAAVSPSPATKPAPAAPSAPSPKSSSTAPSSAGSRSAAGRRPRPTAAAAKRAQTRPDPVVVKIIRPVGRLTLKVFPRLRRAAHYFNLWVQGR